MVTANWRGCEAFPLAPPDSCARTIRATTYCVCEQVALLGYSNTHCVRARTTAPPGSTATQVPSVSFYSPEWSQGISSEVGETIKRLAQKSMRMPAFLRSEPLAFN